MKLTLFFLLMIAFGACTESDDKEPSIAERNPDEVTPAEQFRQKLDSLENVEQKPEILAEKEQTHLDYGIYLIYNADPASMKENANAALEQFIEVLKINPDNQKAISEIDQILGIYNTFPDREPNEEIAEDLRELGFDV